MERRPPPLLGDGPRDDGSAWPGRGVRRTGASSPNALGSRKTSLAAAGPLGDEHAQAQHRRRSSAQPTPPSWPRPEPFARRRSSAAGGRRRSSWQGPPLDVVIGFRKLRESIELLWRRAEQVKAPALTGSQGGDLLPFVVDAGLPRQEVRQSAVALRRLVSQLSRAVFSAFSAGAGVAPCDSADGSPKDDSAKDAHTFNPASPAPQTVQLSQGLMGSIAVHGLLSAVTREVRAERATLFMHVTERNSTSGASTARLVSVAVSGSTGKAMPPIRIQCSYGVAGQVFQTALALNVQDTEKCSRDIFNGAVDHRTGFFTKSLLCMPLSAPPSSNLAARVSEQGNPAGLVGVLQVLNKLPGSSDGPHTGFTEADEAKLLEHCKLLTAVLSSFGLDPHMILAHSQRIQNTIISSADERAGAEGALQLPPPTHPLTFSEATARLERARAQVQRLKQKALEAQALVPSRLRGEGPSMLICRVGGEQDGRNQQIELKSVSGPAELREVSIYIERVEECWRESRNTAVRLQGQVERLQKRLQLHHQDDGDTVDESVGGDRRQSVSPMPVLRRARSRSRSVASQEPGDAATRASDRDEYDKHCRRRGLVFRDLQQKMQTSDYLRSVVSDEASDESGSPDRMSWRDEGASMQKQAQREMLRRHMQERDMLFSRQEDEKEDFLKLLVDELNSSPVIPHRKAIWHTRSQAPRRSLTRGVAGRSTKARF